MGDERPDGCVNPWIFRQIRQHAETGAMTSRRKLSLPETGRISKMLVDETMHGSPGR